MKNQFSFYTSSICKVAMVSLISIAMIGLSACGGGSGGEDTTAPVIVLTGSTDEVVFLDSAYSDDGAIAIDDTDTVVTVTSTGLVDTSTAGTYTITYNAVDSAGNEADDVTRTITVVEVPVAVEGSEKFQVLDEKLVMESSYDGDIYSTEILTYGIELLEPNPDFISLEGDLNLISNFISGAAARARITLEVKAESASTDNYVEFVLAFESRFEGVVSRAFIKTAEEETAITGIHNLPLMKGTPTFFKVEFLEGDTDFAELTIGEYSAVIRVAELPASDMQFQAGSFNAYVEFPIATNYVEGSVDNIVLKLKENSVEKAIIQDFSGFEDGSAPVEDEYFNSVSVP